jgi:hypothetical protein
MVAIGKLYFSAGDYANAVDAIQKGLAKGGVADADDANMLADCSRGQLRESGLFWRADAPPPHPPLPAVDTQSRAYREFFVPS